MRQHAPSITVLACAAAIGCAESDSSGRPTGPSSSLTIHLGGRVVDERTMQGVAGLTLMWGGGRAGLQQLSSSTDATGSYQVDLPNQEYYSVSADRAFPISIVRSIGALDIINFYVNTGGCPTHYGRVIDAVTRRPIAGAEVGWAGLGATTNATGNYRLMFECRPGGYGEGPTTLDVTHSGYQPYSARQTNAENLGVSAADVRSDIALTPR